MLKQERITFPVVDRYVILSYVRLLFWVVLLVGLFFSVSLFFFSLAVLVLVEVLRLRAYRAMVVYYFQLCSEDDIH